MSNISPKLPNTPIMRPLSQLCKKSLDNCLPE
jgi:hypothetical protein